MIQSASFLIFHRPHTASLKLFSSASPKELVLDLIRLLSYRCLVADTCLLYRSLEGEA